MIDCKRKDSWDELKSVRLLATSFRWQATNKYPCNRATVVLRCWGQGPLDDSERRRA